MAGEVVEAEAGGGEDDPGVGDGSQVHGIRRPRMAPRVQEMGG